LSALGAPHPDHELQGKKETLAQHVATCHGRRIPCPFEGSGDGKRVAVRDLISKQTGLATFDVLVGTTLENVDGSTVQVVAPILTGDVIVLSPKDRTARGERPHKVKAADTAARFASLTEADSKRTVFGVTSVAAIQDTKTGDLLAYVDWRQVGVRERAGRPFTSTSALPSGALVRESRLQGGNLMRVKGDIAFGDALVRTKTELFAFSARAPIPTPAEAVRDGKALRDLMAGQAVDFGNDVIATVRDYIERGQAVLYDATKCEYSAGPAITGSKLNDCAARESLDGPYVATCDIEDGTRVDGMLVINDIEAGTPLVRASSILYAYDAKAKPLAFDDAIRGSVARRDLHDGQKVRVEQCDSTARVSHDRRTTVHHEGPEPRKAVQLHLRVHGRRRDQGATDHGRCRADVD